MIENNKLNPITYSEQYSFFNNSTYSYSFQIKYILSDVVGANRDTQNLFIVMV